MLAEFQQHIEENFSHLQETCFLVAVSGGLDSTVLVHLLASSNFNFAIAHCNFRLRGIESEKDEKLVCDIALKLKTKFHITHFDTIGYVNKNKVSIQMAARTLRYRWFEQIMQQNGYETLVTAHHAGDNLETFLINLSRGTGLDGVTGMPAKTDTISRPLLAFSRLEILEYAKSEKLQWREDESNSDTKYLRNKIRHEVIPTLKELNPTFSQNFKNTLENLYGSSLILKNHIETIKTKLFKEKGGILYISIEKIQRLNPIEAYLYELFNGYGFTSWEDIEGLLTGQSGKEVLSSTHRLVKDRENLLLEEIIDSENQEFYIKENDVTIEFPIGLTIEQVEKIDRSVAENILYVDKKTLKYPLMLRKWQDGDYFYPLGMNGKKKVSKFFKDEKLDVISKKKQWLLFSDDKLVWVVGKRSDDRFKVTEKTGVILKFTLL